MTILPGHGHLPMPLSYAGSGITNVVRGLVAAHHRRGGRSRVILSHNRAGQVDHAETLHADFTRFCRREYFLPREYRVDFAAGMLGLPRPYMTRFFWPAVEAMGAGVAPDVVFLHEGHYAASALPTFRRRFPSAKLVYYLHSTISRSYGRRELRRLANNADLIVGVSEYMADHANSRIGPGGPTIIGLLNGVDSTLFRPAERALRPGTGSLRLLFVGQVAQHKGVHLLLEALGRLPTTSQVRVDLRVVGSSVPAAGGGLSPYERGLRRDAAGLASRTTFLSFQGPQELVASYQWADLSVVPSVFDEPCGLVVLEAMACGTPVLGTRSGGIPEVIADTGLLADRTAASLAEQLEWVLGNEEVLRTHAVSARHRAKSLSWDSRLQELDEHLEN